MFFVIIFSIILWSDDKKAIAQTGYSSSGQNITNIYNTGDIIITEIHPQTVVNCLDEYIVIQSNIYYNGKIEIVGLGSSSASINIYTILNTGQKLLITDNIAKINSGNADLGVYIVNSITLTDTGEPLAIRLGSGISVDKVIYDKPNPSDKSKFFGDNSGSVRNFNVNGDPTPSNSCAIALQPTVANAECEIYIKDLSNPSKLKMGIRGNFANICTQGTWSGGNGSVIDNNCGFDLVPVEGYNQLKYTLYSGSQVICQNNYTYYKNTNIVTNCQNNYTVSGNSSTTTSTNSSDNFLDGCGIRLQSSIPLYKEDSVNLAATKRNSIIYNSNNTYKCFWDYGNGITSQECNPPSQKFSYAGQYTVKLSMSDDKGGFCDISYNLNLPSKYRMINFLDDEYYMSGRVYNQSNFIINYTGTIKSGDFVLCDKNYYKLLYEKTKSKYDYFLNLYQISEKDLKYIDSGYILTGLISDLIGLAQVQTKNTDTIRNLLMFSGDSNLQISKILPNPYGSDGSGEYVQIITSTGDLDLRGYYLYYGKKKFALYGNASEEGLNLIDKFGFSNSASCVYLGDDKYIYDVICYNKPKSGYIYGSGSTGDIQNLKDSDNRKFILPLVSNNYESGQLVCGNVKIIDKNIKQIEKLKSQITKLKENNKKLREANAKNRKSFSLRVKKLTLQNKKDKKFHSDKEKFVRYQMYIFRNYTNIINAKLKKDYDIVFADSQIQDYNHLLNVGLRNLASGLVDGYYNGQKIKSYDLKKTYKASNDININDIIGLIAPVINKQHIDQIQYKRNQKYITGNKNIKNKLKPDPKTINILQTIKNSSKKLNTSNVIKKKTGLDKDSVKSIQSNPYQAEYWEETKKIIDSTGLPTDTQQLIRQPTQKIGKDLLSKIADQKEIFSESGPLYNDIRKLKTPVDLRTATDGISNILDKYDIKVKPDGKLDFDGSKFIKGGDLSAIQDVFNRINKNIKTS